MKKIIANVCIACIIGICSQALFAQKPSLDTGLYTLWPQVANGVISNNGSYVLYEKKTHALYSDRRHPFCLMIQSIKNGWRKEIVNGSKGAFTADSRMVCFNKGKDSLGLITLGSAEEEYISSVSSFQLFKQDKSEWLVYLQGGPKKRLVLKNLTTMKVLLFENVQEYVLQKDVLVYKTTPLEGEDSTALYWINLTNSGQYHIGNFTGVGKFVLDQNAKQLAFAIENSASHQKGKAFYIYEEVFSNAQILADNTNKGIDPDLELNEVAEFSLDGEKLFISLRKKENLFLPKDEVMVNIWNYADPQLQSLQQGHSSPRNYMAVLNLKEGRIFRLEQENEKIQWKTNDAVGVVHVLGDTKEDHWSNQAQRTVYSVSLTNGRRTRLPVDFRGPVISPNNGFVGGLAYDWEDIWSYDIKKGITHNLTVKLPGAQVKNVRLYLSKSKGFNFAGWLNGNKGIIINDAYDILLLDPTNKKAPVNLTNGFGRKNNIRFDLLMIYNGRIESTDDWVIVSAFNQHTKETGFYRMSLKGAKDPEMLTMGPYTYKEITPALTIEQSPVYLLKRESTTQSLNYFWTKDFKTLNPISNICQEKKFNWHTSELHSFKTLDGRLEQGILYKPENFDAAKKYPVIIHYYESKTHELNTFHQPVQFDGADLEISWFVSRGYIVFTPDINSKTGYPGLTALNTVEGAAKFLCQFSWINAKKIGIQGHSFGGYETNYITTHSKKYAAAVSSSGPSNLISFYGDIEWSSFQPFMEVGQLAIGASLWEKLDLYIENSPVFMADSVSAPLLILNNKGDKRVPFLQGLELYNALRRHGKPCWMLQYDRGGHGLGGAEYSDYVMRITQFFDHYLKDAPAPEWMKEGIRAEDKGNQDGLEPVGEKDKNEKFITPGITSAFN